MADITDVGDVAWTDRTYDTQCGRIDLDDGEGEGADNRRPLIARCVTDNWQLWVHWQLRRGWAPPSAGSSLWG